MRSVQCVQYRFFSAVLIIMVWIDFVVKYHCIEIKQRQRKMNAGHGHGHSVKCSVRIIYTNKWYQKHSVQIQSARFHSVLCSSIRTVKFKTLIWQFGVYDLVIHLDGSVNVCVCRHPTWSNQSRSLQKQHCSKRRKFLHKSRFILHFQDEMKR